MRLAPDQMITFATASMQAGHPLLMTGAPGIGKSEIIESAVRALKYKMILSHPVVSDPTDYKGFPFPSDDRTCATFLPFGDLKRAIDAKEPTVWFFDDVGQAPTSVQSALMQLWLARQVNGHKISKHIRFIAATNRRVDRAGVSGIIEPFKSRFLTILELVANPQQWAGWAIDHGVEPEIIAYHRFKPDSFCNFQPSADLTNSPVPRTWYHVDQILKMQLPADIRTAAIQGAIGEGYGIGFVAFLDMYRALPSIDQIFANPDKAPIPTRLDAQYAISTALAARMNKKTVRACATYMSRMMDAKLSDFVMLTYRDALRRDETLAYEAPMVTLMAGELGTRMSGAPVH